MKRLDYPEYAKAVEAYRANDRNQVKSLLQGPMLSQCEKALLRIRLAIRDAEFARALDLLRHLNPANAFFQGEKEILTSGYYFFIGEFEKAAEYNLRALECYSLVKDQQGCFFSYYNLSADFGRMGSQQLSHFYLEKSRALAQGQSQLSLVYRALACHFSQQEDFVSACSWLDKAIVLEKELSFNDRMALYVVAGDIFFRSGKYQKSLYALKMLYKDRRKNRETARIEFEYKILSCFLEKKALPDLSAEVGESIEYQLKWNILRALQSGEIRKAESLWQNLRQKWPLRYGERFSCLIKSEEKSIFYSYLSFLKVKTEQDLIAQASSHFLPEGKLANLHQALKDSEMPLSKEHLIEMIWGVSYQIHYDARFYKLVERLKKISPHEIVVENRAYRYRTSLQPAG